jgi:RNA polymerase sigma-70 factor (ECF subfamily)
VRTEERQEYEWVFRAAYPRILGAVTVILGARALAEEVTQEAFLKLYENWHRVGDFQAPEAWVRRVAVRLAVRQARRERARTHLERTRTDIEEQHDASLPDVDLARAVASLTPMQRAAVALFYFEDQPVADIARALGVSDSTIKQHLFRARGHLANLLSEEVADDVH